jgi:putative hemolysin
MELGFEKGRYRLRLSRAAGDIAAAQALRGRCFRGGGRDADALDARCHHLLIEARDSGALLACLRLLPLPDGAALAQSYAAGVYDLAPLAGLAGGFLELGRFCVAPEARDPDILRLALGALVRIVEGEGGAPARYLIGCSSFHGTDWQGVAAALGLLAARHLAPPARQVGCRAPERLDYPRLTAPAAPDLRAAQAQMPPLLRSYLTMGGEVSDHAVIDRDLNTIHVFTLVDTAAIPAPRLAALRALAG